MGPVLSGQRTGSDRLIHMWVLVVFDTHINYLGTVGDDDAWTLRVYNATPGNDSEDSGIAVTTNAKENIAS